MTCLLPEVDRRASVTSTDASLGEMFSIDPMICGNGAASYNRGAVKSYSLAASAPGLRLAKQRPSRGGAAAITSQELTHYHENPATGWGRYGSSNRAISSAVSLIFKAATASSR
jgi:hypothetical protein